MTANRGNTCQFLSDIHRRFYEAYDEYLASGKKEEGIKLPKRRGSMAKPPAEPPREWDVRVSVFRTFTLKQNKQSDC